MILHVLDATASGATQLQIHSPDTDVFVLALRCYPELCENTLFVTGRGQQHRMIELKPIAQTLGPEKIAVLPAFHAINRANNTGRFSGKGKLLCWKVFAEAHPSIISALAELGQAAHPNEEIIAAIENFVCLLYQPRTALTSVKSYTVRWFLFKKKLAQSDRLPPTQGSRVGTVVRALAFHQCVPASIPGPSIICGLSLLVLYSAPRDFSPGTLVFPSPQKPTFDLI